MSRKWPSVGPGVDSLPILPRGVHFADYLVDNCRVMLAIDSRGNCIQRIKLGPDRSEMLSRAHCDGMLDHYDPVPAPPVLRLVKPARERRMGRKTT
jgi:hypothetical protein